MKTVIPGVMLTLLAANTLAVVALLLLALAGYPDPAPVSTLEKTLVYKQGYLQGMQSVRCRLQQGDPATCTQRHPDDYMAYLESIHAHEH